MNWKAILIGVLIIVLGGVATLFLRGGGKEELNEAQASYLAGENATTMAEREDAFNRALSLYSKLEQDYHPEFGNGKLYFNLANAFFQVRAYPMALFYYYKSAALRPRDDKVQHNLMLTKEKLGIMDEKVPSAFEKIFFFHNFLSLPERLQLFFVLSILLLIFGFSYLWTQQRWVKTGIGVLLVFWSVMLLSIGYTRYISPLEGVLVQSTDLYRDAGLQYAKVSEKPLFSGSKVEVLDIWPNGKWLKIITPEGEVGYVPNTAIRLI